MKLTSQMPSSTDGLASECHAEIDFLAIQAQSSATGDCPVCVKCSDERDDGKTLAQAAVAPARARSAYPIHFFTVLVDHRGLFSSPWHASPLARRTGVRDWV
jgi:hypothetical protein